VRSTTYLLSGLGIDEWICYVKVDVLERRCLCDLPMDTTGLGILGRRRDVNEKVPNAAEEVIRVQIPLGLRSSVDIGAKDAQANETRRGEKGWRIEGVSKQLGIVILGNGAADKIRSGWEVNSRRVDAAAAAVGAISSAIRYGQLDCSRVIRHAVAQSAVVLQNFARLCIRRARKGAYSKLRMVFWQYTGLSLSDMLEPATPDPICVNWGSSFGGTSY
jgi:hypothetical protein